MVKRVFKVLTAVGITKIKAPDKRAEIPDGTIRGLFLVVQTSGSKSFVLKYRDTNRQRVKLTLGHYSSLMDDVSEPKLGGLLSLAGARRLATLLSHEKSLGHDIRKSKEDRALTFLACAKLYLEQAKKNQRRWRHTASMLGLDNNGDLIKGSLSDRWKNRAITSITQDDVFHIVSECRDKAIPGTVARTSGPSEARARTAHCTLSGLFNFLIETRRLKISPIVGLKRPDPPNAKSRVLSDNEIAAFWTSCDHLGVSGDLLKTLLLTGCRLREISELQKIEVRDEGIYLNKNRTKNSEAHFVPLSPAAAALVERNMGDAEFVFSVRKGKPFTGFSKLKRRIDELMGEAITDHWTFHDLRRTFAYTCGRCRVQAEVIERLLNHKSNLFSGVAGVYQRYSYQEEQRDAVNRVEDFILRIVSGQSSNVVALRA